MSFAFRSSPSIVTCTSGVSRVSSVEAAGSRHFASGSVLLGLIHEVTAIIFTSPTFSRADHFIARLDEFLFLQIYSPCVNGSHGFTASLSYAGTYDRVFGRGDQSSETQSPWRCALSEQRRVSRRSGHQSRWVELS